MSDTCYFSDGVRQIDFVLAYYENDPDLEEELLNMEDEESFVSHGDVPARERWMIPTDGGVDTPSSIGLLTPRSRGSLGSQKSSNKSSGTEQRLVSGSDDPSKPKEKISKTPPDLPPKQNENEEEERLLSAPSKSKSPPHENGVSPAEGAAVPTNEKKESNRNEVTPTSGNAGNSGKLEGTDKSSRLKNTGGGGKEKMGKDLTPNEPNREEQRTAQPPVVIPKEDQKKQKVTSVPPKTGVTEKAPKEKTTTLKSVNIGSTEKNGAQLRRHRFQKHLLDAGLHLEAVPAPEPHGLSFVLIHAPFDVLETMAHVMRVKVPVREGMALPAGGAPTKSTMMSYEPIDQESRWRKFSSKIFSSKFSPETSLLLQDKTKVYHTYHSLQRKSFQNSEDPAKLFSTADRSRMTYEILNATSYGKDCVDSRKTGIERLLRHSVYQAAYPLHQTVRQSSSDQTPVNPQDMNQRELLLKFWGNFRMWRTEQPLDLIKDYFGAKIAFYFAWLGVYTKMLLIPTMMSFLWLTFLAWMLTKQSIIDEVCNDRGTILCPKCDTMCDFRFLNETCQMARVSYSVDNSGVFIWGLFVSIWAHVFLKMWKRKQASLCYRWGLMDPFYQEKTVRLDFKLRVKNYRIDPVTETSQPYHKRKKLMLNAVVNLICIAIVALVMIGTLVFVFYVRVHVENFVVTLYHSSTSDILTTFAVSAICGFINLVIILIFNQIYQYVSYKCVNWENPRTQMEFDNAFIIKIFTAQFVNTNSSLFFIAFVQPIIARRLKFFYSRETGIGIKSCHSNCFVELSLQMAIIFIGVQVAKAFAEILVPLLMSRMKMCRTKVGVWCAKGLKKKRVPFPAREDRIGKARFEEDYYLYYNEAHFLCFEYLEIVMQYAVLVLFTPVFPMAPFFALLNNIIEIRSDAIKYLKYKQRPVPEEMDSIGIWTSIIETVSKIGIVVNAVIIAFTSDFVPMAAWIWEHGSYSGYTNHSYASFDVRILANFHENVMMDSPHFIYNPENKTLGIAGSATPRPNQCKLYGFYKPPCEDDRNPNRKVECAVLGEIELSHEWWVNCVFRLLFALLFISICMSVRYLIDRYIPDMPVKISNKLQKDKYLAKRRLLIGSSAETVNAIMGPTENKEQNEPLLREAECVPSVVQMLLNKAQGHDDLGAKRRPKHHLTLSVESPSAEDAGFFTVVVPSDGTELPQNTSPHLTN